MGGWREVTLPEGNSHIKRVKCKMLVVSFGIKKDVLVSVKVLSLKRFTVRAFAMPYRLFSRKNITGHNKLFKIGPLEVKKKLKPHSHSNIIRYFF